MERFVYKHWTNSIDMDCSNTYCSSQRNDAGFTIPAGQSVISVYDRHTNNYRYMCESCYLEFNRTPHPLLNR